MNTTAYLSSKPDDIAAEVLAVMDRREQIEPISNRHSGLDLSSAYEIAAEVRRP